MPSQRVIPPPPIHSSRITENVASGIHSQPNKLIADFCREPKSVQEIMDEFEFDSRTSFRRKYLTPMLKNCVLKMAIPEKPSSKNQKYFS